jgi:hypothetical protein
MYDSDVTWSDVKETAEQVYFVDLKHNFWKFRTAELVFISELSRTYQGGVEEYLQGNCREELNTPHATRLTVGHMALELIKNPQQTSR